MDNYNSYVWKYPLIKQQKTQIIRVFRPKEIHALIDNIRIEDEPTWSKGRDTPSLTDTGFTTEDIQRWLQFFLYSGCRFSEGIMIHDYRDERGNTLYQDNGTLWLPRYKGKKKRSIQTRTIYFSYRGRDVMEDFFLTPQLPSSTTEETRQTLTSLSEMMHRAGKRINLPEKTLTISLERTLKDRDGNPMKEMVPTKQFTQNPDGTYSKVMKERIMTETEEKEVTTNGCAFRSLRKTWESWPTAYYGNNPQMRERILTSQGHKKEVALTHYLEISFDREDMEDIGKEVEGFAILD